MKKNILLLAGILALALALFTGCGHEHTWTDATCTQPKTCSECGETEGEPLGHTFAPATYQQPATCTVCGATEGDPLPPAFEEMGVQGQFMELGQTYNYLTLCYDNPTVKTNCEVTVTDYQVIDSDENHPAKEGYEWRIANFDVHVYDTNSQAFGYQIKWFPVDYYDFVSVADSAVSTDTVDPVLGTLTTFTVNINGQDYPCERYTTSSSTGWNETGDSLNIYREYDFLVPKGYDGAVVALCNAANVTQEDMYINEIADEDSLLFRLQ